MDDSHLTPGFEQYPSRYKQLRDRRKKVQRGWMRFVWGLIILFVTLIVLAIALTSHLDAWRDAQLVNNDPTYQLAHNDW